MYTVYLLINILIIYYYSYNLCAYKHKPSILNRSNEIKDNKKKVYTKINFRESVHTVVV